MFRRATEGDLDAVVGIYQRIFDYEEAHTCYSNWTRGLYPSRQVAEAALDAGTLFVQVDEQGLVGSVVLNHEQAPGYADLMWDIPASEAEVLVIHTLCIDPACSGRGYARKTLAFAEAVAREMGCRVIRLDTDQGNLPAATLYHKFGYHYAGDIPFHIQETTWYTLKCFEKAI